MEGPENCTCALVGIFCSQKMTLTVVSLKRKDDVDTGQLEQIREKEKLNIVFEVSFATVLISTA